MKTRILELIQAKIDEERKNCESAGKGYPAESHHGYAWVILRELKTEIENMEG